jgi:site-specific recombinase XerD
MNDTKELVEQVLKKIAGAYSPATIRAYRADFSNFMGFCMIASEDALPANSATVARFVGYLTNRHLRSSTIRRSIAALATIHKLNRLPDPTNDPDVQLEMRRMFRQLGRGSRQAEPIDQDRLEKMLKEIPLDLRGLRDRALLLLAYDTLLRRGELVAIETQHIIWPKGRLEDPLKIYVPRSKTDQEGLGRHVVLSRRSSTCIEDYINAASIREGRLFRGIQPSGELNEGLGVTQVNRIFKKRANAAGFSDETVSGISGHSLRVGAAHDMLKLGASLAVIMHRGRWSKPDTVMRYVEKVSIGVLPE